MKKNHPAENEQNQHGGAQIGLDDDQRGRNKPDGQHGNKILPAKRAAVARQDAGRKDKHGKLGQLGGLDAHQTQREPSLRAVNGFAHDWHQEEQNQGDPEKKATPGFPRRR